MFDDGRWLHIFHCQDKETGSILHDDLCIITVELPVWLKLSKPESGSILDPLGKWLYFLTHAKGAERDMLLDWLRESLFEEAMDVITGFTKEQKLRHAYDMRENQERIVQSYIHTGFLEGKQEGLQEGLEKGKQEGFQDGAMAERRNLAKKLKAAGNPLEQVVELTGLSTEEINSL